MMTPAEAKATYNALHSADVKELLEECQVAVCGVNWDGPAPSATVKVKATMGPSMVEFAMEQLRSKGWYVEWFNGQCDTNHDGTTNLVLKATGRR